MTLTFTASLLMIQNVVDHVASVVFRKIKLSIPGDPVLQ